MDVARSTLQTVRRKDLEPTGVETLRRILMGSVHAGASDIHMRHGRAPMVRLHGELRVLEHPELDESEIELFTQILAEQGKVPDTRLLARQCNFACEARGVGRFRVHAYTQDGSRALVLRTIPSPIPDFAELRIPPVMKRLTELSRGLVLVTGATGNGKSTTIASLLDRVNQERAKHIVTIEEPIEFLFDDNRSSFSQREIGRDVDDAQSGLHGALREDPDWIFVGEIRTAEELELALGATEAGHVVVSTLHAQDAMRAIQRMVQLYPEARRDTVHQRLADSLEALVSQRLVPRRGGVDRVLVTEVLLRTPTIQDCIRDPARLRAIPKALDAGVSEYGTHTFDHQLFGLVRDGVIAADTARAVASVPNDLARALQMGKRI
ncbi:MAG: PilT/PilU family type 4a pilus ATPase [Myxococcales bacterium]|nr:PilT/PilU family type 4a pilus ATPase [Myxococcales bacterium]